MKTGQYGLTAMQPAKPHPAPAKLSLPRSTHPHHLILPVQI